MVLSAGLLATGKDFVNRLSATPPGAISGFAFNDINNNAKLDSTESGQAGVFVFLDSNHDGIWNTGEPATLTQASGQYLFANLPPGTYQVRAQLAAGEKQTTALSPTVVSSGQTQSADIGLGTTVGIGAVSGAVFLDSNDNGRLDAGETGISGQQVYLDLNKDGVWQTTEPTATTDVNGRYAFTGLPAGSYDVREITPVEGGTGSYYQTNSSQFYNPLVAVKSGATTTVNIGDRKSTGPISNAVFNFTVAESALQADGKLVAVGSTGSAAAGTAKSVIARYNPDGTPDLTFGVAGEVTSLVGVHQSQANDVSIGLDGHIVVAGDSDMNYGYSGGNQVAIAGGSAGYVRRYNADGSADPSLSFITPAAGFVAGTKPQYGALQHLSRVYVNNDGTIVAIGAGANYDLGGKVALTDYIRVYEFNATGSLNVMFGTGGSVKLATDSVGKILTSNAAFNPAGGFEVPGAALSGAVWNFVVQQFNVDGTLVGSSQGTAVSQSSAGTPYGGTPAPFGRIQAENFDYGGQNVGDYNPTNFNQGGYYRPSENVGIGAIPAADGGGYDVGYMSPGEWIDYTVSVAATDTYTLNFRAVAASRDAPFI